MQKNTTTTTTTTTFTTTTTATTTTAAATAAAAAATTTTTSSSSSSIDSTTLGGSWSVQQFYSTPVYPRPSPSNQQFSSYLGLLLPGPSTLTWASLLVLFYMAKILLFFW